MSIKGQTDSIAEHVVHLVHPVLFVIKADASLAVKQVLPNVLVDVLIQEQIGLIVVDVGSYASQERFVPTVVVFCLVRCLKWLVVTNVLILKQTEPIVEPVDRLVPRGKSVRKEVAR